MTTTTTRFGILRPVTTDPAAGAPTTGLTKYITSPTDRLEALGAQYGQGTLASRPSASIAGRFYWATDAKAIYYDTGSAWVLFASSPVVFTLAGTVSIPATPGVLAGATAAIHLSVAGTYRFTLSADIIGSITGDTVAWLDLDVYLSSTHYRAAGTGGQMQVVADTVAYRSVSKQFIVTVPGAADVDIYGDRGTGAGASSIILSAELIA